MSLSRLYGPSEHDVMGIFFVFECVSFSMWYLECHCALSNDDDKVFFYLPKTKYLYPQHISPFTHTWNQSEVWIRWKKIAAMAFEKGDICMRVCARCLFCSWIRKMFFFAKKYSISCVYRSIKFTSMGAEMIRFQAYKLVWFLLY